MNLAARTTRISVSPTMKVAADAMKLKAQGVDIVDFGAGEPDFPTPPHVSAAAHRAIDALAQLLDGRAGGGGADVGEAEDERENEDEGTQAAHSTAP